MKLSHHTNFLNSKLEYEKTRLFWKTLFDKIKPDSFEYVDNKYKNSTEILDGNPVFTACYSNNYAIRIIQNRITAHEPLFTCWTQKSVLNKTEISELVIYLQPLDYILDDIKILIALQANAKISNRVIQKVNKKYQVKWDLLRSKRIIRRLESLNILMENITDDFEINQGRLKEFTSIVAIENFYINVPSQRVVNPVSIALQRVETRLQKLNNIITLKGSLVMTSVPKLKTYNNKIKVQYSSKSNFNRSIKSKIIELKTEVAELKLKSEL